MYYTMGLIMIEEMQILKSEKRHEIYIREKSKYNTKHDLLFKQLIRYCFVDFLKAFYPTIYEQINPETIHFLPEEVYTDISAGKTRKLDIVAKLKHRITGSVMIVHVESQSTVQRDFHKRMYLYYNLLYKEYQRPIIPIAIFNYPGKWEENVFTIQALDTIYVQFQYHILHLKKIYWREYIKMDNPVVAALLSNMSYKEERYQVKAEFMRMLAKLKLNNAKQRLIYGFFNSYLRLTKEEEEKYMKMVKGFDEAEEIMKIKIPYFEELKQEIREESLKEVAMKMLLDGFTLEKITEITGLTQEQLEEVKLNDM